MDLTSHEIIEKYVPMDMREEEAHKVAIFKLQQREDKARWDARKSLRDIYAPIWDRLECMERLLKRMHADPFYLTKSY